MDGMNGQILVEMKAITKVFPGVVALQDVDLTLLAGEVHVVLGENGAGKSTLMKVLSGVYHPTSGAITVKGQTYSGLDPHLARELGISIIYQELSLVDQISIGENLFVGNLPTRRVLGFPMVDFKSINAATSQALGNLGWAVDPRTIVGALRISEKQLIEIARALSAKARILIMDEPTSSLTIEETRKLFSIIRRLKDDGVGIIYISHKLEEIKQIGDRVTVLKDGARVDTRNVADIQVEEMISMMVGRELKSKYLREIKHAYSHRDVVFSVKNLTRGDRKVVDVSFDAYEGEILGFAGLVGAGRTELMEAIFRSVPVDSGELILRGRTLRHKNPYGALREGIALLTENRRETGVFGNFGILENIVIPKSLKSSGLGGLWGMIKRSLEKDVATQQVKSLSIKCASIEQNISELSGGNQQKVIVGKWLATGPQVIIFDEPTKGIDVGAKAEIYGIMHRLAQSGITIIVVSSELPELLSVCDRIIVFNTGKITAVFTNAEATEEKIAYAATVATA